MTNDKITTIHSKCIIRIFAGVILTGKYNIFTELVNTYDVTHMLASLMDTRLICLIIILISVSPLRLCYDHEQSKVESLSRLWGLGIKA